ncbi:MAG: polysaccharide lyase, partial [Chitinophagaceae bacterium]
MKYLVKKILPVVAIAFSINVNAQYPTITAAVQRASDSLMKVAVAHSDSAWDVAYPIIKQEAAQGKPYIPWAAKPDDLPQSDIPAFPGAEGGGKFSFGGRGGRVIVVTNLNDEGPGSFRWACEQGGARIVVFNVSGIIRIKTPVIIRAPYISIEGQTAPGDGVCIAGESVW